MELKNKYKNEIVEKMQKEFKLPNSMAVPTLKKITLNIGMGEGHDNPNTLEKMTADFALMTGQKPVITKAKKAISNFKIRKGFPVGIMVTLRGEKMWDFYFRLVNIVIPRIRDFRGLSVKSFDKQGNYSMGIKEHTIFPEIDPTNVDKVRSFEISIVTNSKDPKLSRKLLEYLGMPFERK